MNCECDRCGQTCLTEAALNHKGLCVCCQLDLDRGVDPWQESVDHVAEKLKEAIDEQILKEVTSKNPNQ